MARISCPTRLVSVPSGWKEPRYCSTTGLSFSRASDYPEGGKRSTESDRLQSIKDAQELGAVFMRLAHYPHSREMARLADRMGMLLWEEIPVYWAIDFQNEGTYQDAENQLRELIRRDKNRASVIIWSVGNENEDTDDRLSFMSRLAETAKHVDPSRLVSAACLVNQRKLAIEDRLMPISMSSATTSTTAGTTRTSPNSHGFLPTPISTNRW